MKKFKAMKFWVKDNSEIIKPLTIFLSIIGYGLPERCGVKGEIFAIEAKKDGKVSLITQKNNTIEGLLKFFNLEVEGKEINIDWMREVEEEEESSERDMDDRVAMLKRELNRIRVILGTESNV